MVSLYVPDWLCRDKGLRLRPKGKIVAETDKAVLFSTTDFVRAGKDASKVRKEVWLPKSEVVVRGVEE